MVDTVWGILQKKFICLLFRLGTRLAIGVLLMVWYI